MMDFSDVDIKFVRMAAQAHWAELQDYKDAIITVYEVEDTFPAIFFLQEIKSNVIDVKINCIQAASERIKSYNTEHKETAHQLLSSERNDHGHKTFKKLYNLIEGQLNCNVGDGLATYMGLFFAQNGYQVLDESINQNYIMLIELFQEIEYFLATLQKGLNILESHSQSLMLEIFEEKKLVKSFFNICFAKLHKFLKAHHEIRDRCQIDYLLAQERDKMADESDDSD